MNIKQIEIDHDVYAFILQNTSEIGESASSILRRLLGLTSGAAAPSKTPLASHEKSELAMLLESSDFIYAKGVVGRFLVLLGWIYRRNPEGFAKVEGIKGRGRLYFAKKPEILKSSGHSVNPKQIPSTPFWVITTTPTILKQEIIQRVMQSLGYSPSEIAAASRAIAEVAPLLIY
jgi:negative modulator of initiation of replication